MNMSWKTDSPCCANCALKRTATEQEKNFPPEIAKAIMEKFYMDDYLDSFNDVNKAIYTAHSVTKMLSSGGFHLTKLISNSRFILRSLRTSSMSPKIVDLDFNKLPIEKALGIIWDIKSDLLKVKAVSKTFPCTKRGSLSCVSSTFDPLGIINPSVLEAKPAIQELWKRNTGWDIEIQNDLKQKCDNWKNSLDDIEKIEIPCWYGFILNPKNLIELHIFADSFSKAYCAVSCLRVISSNSINCAFMAGNQG